MSAIRSRPSRFRSASRLALRAASNRPEVRTISRIQIDRILRGNADEQTGTTWIARKSADHGDYGLHHGRLRQRILEQNTRRIALAGTDIDAGQSGRPRNRGVLMARERPLHRSELFLA